MYDLGIGLEGAYHPWSKDGHTYTSAKLLSHLVDVVIPLNDTADTPTEAPITAPKLAVLQKVGTISKLSEEKEKLSKDEDAKFKADGKAEVKRRQDLGLMDIWSEKQQSIPPPLSQYLKMWVEVAFEYPGEEGDTCIDWYRGQISKVINAKKFRVQIDWDTSTLAETDVKVSRHSLIPSNWNPKKIRKNAWRMYLTE